MSPGALAVPSHPEDLAYQLRPLLLSDQQDPVVPWRQWARSDLSAPPDLLRRSRLVVRARSTAPCSCPVHGSDSTRPSKCKPSRYRKRHPQPHTSSRSTMSSENSPAVPAD